MVTLAEQAVAFRRLHEGPSMLVLPNAWDAASARAFVAAGFLAIATTSVLSLLSWDGQCHGGKVAIDLARSRPAPISPHHPVMYTVLQSVRRLLVSTAHRSRIRRRLAVLALRHR